MQRFIWAFVRDFGAILWGIGDWMYFAGKRGVERNSKRNKSP